MKKSKLITLLSFVTIACSGLGTVLSVEKNNSVQTVALTDFAIEIEGTPAANDTIIIDYLDEIIVEVDTDKDKDQVTINRVKEICEEYSIKTK